MNEVMWAVLSEWDMINTEVKALVSNGLFLTNYETFMSCDCVRGGRGGGEEYLGLDECGLREMSGDLKES